MREWRWRARERDGSSVTPGTSPSGAGTPLRSGRKRERVCRESELRDDCQGFDRRQCIEQAAGLMAETSAHVCSALPTKESLTTCARALYLRRGQARRSHKAVGAVEVPCRGRERRERGRKEALLP